MVHKAHIPYAMENAPYVNEAVANVIKRLRKEKNLTQEQLAGFARTSRSQIAQLESGKRGVTLNTLYWIADGVGLSFDEILALVLNAKRSLKK